MTDVFDDQATPDMPDAPNGPMRRRKPSGRTRALDPRDPMRMAEAFIQHFAETPLVYLGSDWLIWNGSQYEMLGPGGLHSKACLFLDAQHKWHKGKLMPFAPTRKDAAELISALAGCLYCEPSKDGRPFWIRDVGLDPVEILVLRNGLLHVPTRTFLPPSRDYLCSISTDYDYVPEPGPPTALFHFLEVTKLTPDEIDLLQEIFGYMLVARNPLQKVFLFIGPPRAGKGTLDRLLTKLVGEGNTGSIPPLFADRFDLAHLTNVSIARIPDLRISPKQDTTDLVQRLLTISGNDTVAISRKFQSTLSRPLPCRILITSNEVPRLTDSGGAIYGRIVPLQLTESFLNREDPDLEARLQAELPSILKWALDGYERLMERRKQFVLPDSSTRVLLRMEVRSSPMAAFIRHTCVLDSAAVTPKFVIYDAWQAFRDEMGLPPDTLSVFSRRLLEACTQISLPKPRGATPSGRINCYAGIRLRNTQENQS